MFTHNEPTLTPTAVFTELFEPHTTLPDLNVLRGRMRVAVLRLHVKIRSLAFVIFITRHDTFKRLLHSAEIFAGIRIGTDIHVYSAH